MSIRIVNSLQEDIWRLFVDQHAAGTVFHTPEMFEVFAHAEKHEPSLWAAINTSQEVLALLLPVNVSVLSSMFRRLTTRNVSYGSVLCAPGIEGLEALGLLLKTYKNEVTGNPLLTELRNLSDLNGSQPILQEGGFVYEPHLNYLINLCRPIDQIELDMKGDVAQNVKRGRRMGVVIEDITLMDQISSVYAVLSKVYRRIKVPLAPLSLFESAFRILFPRNMIKIIAARLDGAYIGAAVRLLYKDQIFAWYAGALREYSKYKAHDLLNWHILEWGAENGFKTFDFGGAGKPDQSYGPRDYKAKFGWDVVNFGLNTYIHAPLRLKLSSKVYQLWRKTF
jgi:serine/alanine adding enzyme